MPVDTWDQTVQIAKDAKIIPGDPDAGAYRTDLADAARQGITGDVNGNSFQGHRHGDRRRQVARQSPHQKEAGSARARLLPYR